MADHVQAYQRKMARTFKKRVKPRPLQKGDLVLRILRGLIGDPRGKFRPSWSGDSCLTSQPDLLIKNIYKTYDLILA